MSRLDALLDNLTVARVYDLEQPWFQGMPNAPAHAPGFVYLLHRRHEAGTGQSRTSAPG